jgi:hypothetical protein
MVAKCISGKRLYPTETVAEDVLIELWNKNEYAPNRAPLNVYQCDECGYYHLTSRGPMNERLARYLSTHQAKIDKEASKWLNRFKKRN